MNKKYFIKNNSIFTLEKLFSCMKKGKYCVVGAGPSLNLCGSDIKKLITEEYIFILSDSIAHSFIQKFPKSKRIIFTVEYRYHNYLKKLTDEKIAIYQNSNLRNFSSILNEYYLFNFVKENNLFNIKNLISLISAGTVVGAQLSWVLYCAKIIKFKEVPKIYLIGIDLSFIDSIVYSRYFQSKINYSLNRFYNRMTDEYLSVLKKASHIQVVNKQVIKTSNEFFLTKKNIEKLLSTINFPVNIFDFSPLGISHPLVKKIIPKDL